MAEESSDYDSAIGNLRSEMPWLGRVNQESWDRPDLSQDERYRRLLTESHRGGMSEEETRQYARRQLGVEPANFGEHYRRAGQQNEMEAARGRYANSEETFGHFWRSAISPVANFIETRQYGQAQRRIQDGSATRQDYDTVAEHERLQQIAHNRSLPEQLAHGGISLVGGAMEAVAGGALLRGSGLLPRLFGRAAVPATATTEAVAEIPAAAGRMANWARGGITATTMPSMYLNQIAENNIHAGREATDIRGVPAAMAMAIMNGAVLGSLGHIADNVPGSSIGAYMQRLGTRIPLGMTEQAAVDAVGSFANLSTGYGLGGDVYRWATGEAGAGRQLFAHALIQATTFAAFAGMHEAGGRNPVRDSFLTASRDLARDGMSADRAGRMLDVVTRRLTPEISQERGASISLEQAQAFTDSLPTRTRGQRAIRDYAQQLVDTYTEPRARGEMLQPQSNDPSLTEGPGPLAEQQAAQRQAARETPPQAGQQATPEDIARMHQEAEASQRAPTQADSLPHDQPGIDRLSAGLPVTAEASSQDSGIPAGVLPARPGMPAAHRAVETPQRMAENLDRSLDRMFPGSRRMSDSHGGIVEHGILVETPSGNRQVHLAFDPNRRTIKIDFRNETGPESQIGAQYQKGSRDFAKKIMDIVKWSGDNNVGIISEGKIDIDPRTGRIDKTRQNTYDRMLTRAGFEKGEDGVWRRTQAAQTAHADAANMIRDVVQEEGVSHAEAAEMSKHVDAIVDTVSESRAGGNLEQEIRNAHPEVADALGSRLRRFTALAKEVADGEARNQRVGSGESPSVYGSHERSVQEEARNAANTPESQERPGVQGTEARSRPAEASSGTAPDVAANAPAESRAGEQAGQHGAVDLSDWNTAWNHMTPAEQEQFRQTAQRFHDWMGEQQGKAVRHKTYVEAAENDARHDVGLPPVEPGQEAAKPSVSDLVFGERASFSHREAFENFKQAAKDAWSYLESAAQHLADVFKQHAGVAFPKTARESQRVADAFVQFTKGREAAQLKSGGNKEQEADLRRQYANEDRQNIYRALTEEGVATRGPQNQHSGQYEGLHEVRDGHVSWYFKNADVAHDFNEAINHVPTRYQTIKKAADLLNVATLAAPVEAMTHSKNILTMLANPGVAIKFPGAILKKMMSKPEVAERLAELSHGGVSVSPPGEGSAWSPMTHVGRAIHWLRETTLIAADDAFTMLAKNPLFDVKDTKSARNNFLNQLGNYQIESQNKFTQWLRETGLGPFATAGTNFWAQGIRSVTGNPGIETNSLRGQTILRAWKYGNLAAAGGLVAAMNYLINGKVEGDANTPIGAIKLGTDKSGKTMYFDFMNLTGLTRGLRETGLLALMEGVRSGRPAGAIGDRAFSDALHSAIHPAIGPTAQFGLMLATGENSLGMRLTPRDSQSRVADNARAAVTNINPAVASLGGFNRSPESLPQSNSERALQLLGPYGVRTREDMSRFNTVWHDIENERNISRAKPGERFADEARYQRLNRYHQSIVQIGQSIRRERAGGSEERIAELRQRQNELARRALEQ